MRESDLLEEPEPIRIKADEDQESVFKAEMKVLDLGNLSTGARAEMLQEKMDREAEAA